MEDKSEISPHLLFLFILWVSVGYNAILVFIPTDFVAKHHPPCMRVIVRETNLPKLKVGSLFLITKDGGTVGREGEQHTIIIRDHNVSRVPNFLFLKLLIAIELYNFKSK